MTENRRIFLNIIATYGRSLYGLVVGLLCGTWCLQALGEVDFGLYGLVGGLTAFMTFFNSTLAGANARFYAYSIGAAQAMEDKSAGLEECRRWFNTALSVHTIVPLVLIALGYPIGDYAVCHWLTIPAERIVACQWVWRFVCISCFVSMVNVPFSAMYNAKQYIAELTVYSFCTATLNLFFLWFMITHPGVWLVKYAAWACALIIVPNLIICVRAMKLFPECKINREYLWKKEYLKKLGAYAGWQLAGVFCGMLRTSGMSVVINKFFGARMNAAQTIGNNVQGQCNTLASAMQGAFVPVITQACGAGDFDKVSRFVIRACKFNVLLSAIFMIPLAIELPEVMRLWLRNPPAYSVGLCYCAMIYHIVGCSTVGHMVAVNARGNLKWYYIVLSSINIFTVPLSVVAGVLTHDVYVVSGTVIFMEALNSAGRIYFARRECGIGIRNWIFNVAKPLVIAITLTGIVGVLPSFFMDQSFWRVCVTTVFCELMFLPLCWFVLLNNEERQFVNDKFGSRLRKLLGK